MKMSAQAAPRQLPQKIAFALLGCGLGHQSKAAAMRRSRSFLTAFVSAMAFLVVSFGHLGPHSASRAQENPPAPQLRLPWDEGSVDVGKLYDAVIENVEKTFFDVAKLKQIDWRARADAIRPSVLSAPSLRDAVRQINALLAELKTSHTALLTPDEYFYYMLLDIVGAGQNGADLMARRFWGSGSYYPGTGAFTREIDGRHFVDGVLEGSPADRTGLLYGDEILSVDGAAYSPIAAFRGKIGTTAELTIRRHRDAEPQRLQVAVVPIRPTKAFSEATAASARIIERNGSRIGYAHIWASTEFFQLPKCAPQTRACKYHSATIGGERDQCCSAEHRSSDQDYRRTAKPDRFSHRRHARTRRGQQGGRKTISSSTGKRPGRLLGQYGGNRSLQNQSPARSGRSGDYDKNSELGFSRPHSFVD